MTTFRLLRTVAASLAMATLVASCGGGGGDSGGSIGGVIVPPAAEDTGRGSLVVNPPASVLSITATQFSTLVDSTSVGKQLLQVTGAPTCGINVRSIQYRTVDAKGAIVNATGALMLPSGTEAICNGARPIVVYAHGTSTERNYDMARINDPSQPAAAEGILVAAMFAAQGYIVVAPNYAGYDKSTLGYTPYLNADQNGKEMVDALVASRKALPFLPVSDSGAVLLTGYSQGGYVALAAHKEMQATGRPVTASAPLSSPAAISLLADYTFKGAPTRSATIFTPFLTRSWQEQFGNIYSNTGDIFESQYAAGIATLLPSLVKEAELFATGKLPEFALFPATGVPGPISAAQAPFYGPNNLVKQSYLTQVAEDIAARPCPGNALPATNASLTTTAPLDCAPSNTFRRAAVANDLRNWLPARPVFMCGGSLDPTVNFNSTLATSGYFRARGMAGSQLAVVDLEQPGGAGDPYALARSGFVTAKAQLFNATDGSAEVKTEAVLKAYHGQVVPMFCLVSARGFFLAALTATL